jgi:uncharacterized protein YqhQ
MALANGVLVHGPSSWACAVRGEDGRLRLASGAKPIRSAEVRSPLYRGLVRLGEVLALFPAVRRTLPEARLPFLERRSVAAMAGTAIVARQLRRSRFEPAIQEAIAALIALVPAAIALRGTEIAAYHGAEHITIGSYEHGEPRPRQHERCGSHMLGPLLLTTVVGNVLAGGLASTPAGRALARLGAGAGSIAVAIEIFGWGLRHPEHPLARLLAWPGRELQTRLLTAEPTPDQLEVAKTALAECLRLEHEAAGDGGAL